MPKPFFRPLALLFALAAMPHASAQMHHTQMPHTMPTPTPVGQAKTTPMPVTVQSATIVAVPPSIKETSAFMVIQNTSKQPLALANASAPIAGHTMLMTTIKSANMSGMLPATTMPIPAGGKLTLKPDGYHIMLMNLKRPLKVGETLPIVLVDGQGHRLTVMATVKKP